MTAALLSLLAVLTAGVHIFSLRVQRKKLEWVSKPLVMLLLVVLAATVQPAVSLTYRQLIVIGLLFSLVGDVMLMLPRERFLTGLGAFLLAHVAYLVAFLGRLEGAPPIALLAVLPFVMASALVLAGLWRTLGELKFPVTVYVVFIALMAGAALAVASLQGGRSAWLAAAGATIFVISDAALAMDRFVGHLPNAREIVMTTYFAAQWLITLSVVAG